MKRLALLSIGLVAALGLLACDAGSEGDMVQHSEAISDCGGFYDAQATTFKDSLDYCAARRLHWAYDETTGELRLADKRVLLNCCGDHSIDVHLENGVYVVTERDQPGFGRCGCMCVFDYTAAIQGVPNEAIHLRIEMRVPDWDEVSGQVFEGTLDLTQGSGVVVIDDTPEDMWCRPDVY